VCRFRHVANSAAERPRAVAIHYYLLFITIQRFQTRGIGQSFRRAFYYPYAQSFWSAPQLVSSVCTDGTDDDAINKWVHNNIIRVYNIIYNIRQLFNIIWYIHDRLLSRFRQTQYRFHAGEVRVKMYLYTILYRLYTAYR